MSDVIDGTTFFKNACQNVSYNAGKHCIVNHVFPHILTQRLVKQGREINHGLKQNFYFFKKQFFSYNTNRS